MPISATGPKTTDSRRGERGLTLVELLVGLAIAGLAASAVLLSLPPARDSVPVKAERLAARLRAAADLAVVSGRSIGMEVTQEGYRFYRREAAGWRPLGRNSSLEAAGWPASVEADLVLGRPLFVAAESVRDAAPSPVIRFEPIGLATPFTLQLRAAGEAIRIRGDRAGVITLEPGDG